MHTELYRHIGGDADLGLDGPTDKSPVFRRGKSGNHAFRCLITNRCVFNSVTKEHIYEAHHCTDVPCHFSCTYSIVALVPPMSTTDV